MHYPLLQSYSALYMQHYKCWRWTFFHRFMGRISPHYNTTGLFQIPPVYTRRIDTEVLNRAINLISGLSTLWRQLSRVLREVRHVEHPSGPYRPDGLRDHRDILTSRPAERPYDLYGRPPDLQNFMGLRSLRAYGTTCPAITKKSWYPRKTPLSPPT